MIQINLLPGARRKKAAVNQPIDFKAVGANLAGRVKDRYLIVTSALTVVGLAALAFLYFTQQHRETTLNERKDKAIADSTRYANFLKDRYKAEAVRDTLLRQVNIIRSLDEDRYVWPHILDDVSRALPQYTWLMGFGAAGTPQGNGNVVVLPAADTNAKRKKGPPKRLDTDVPKDVIQLKLTGRTVDVQAMTRFMRDLEASPFLTVATFDKSEPTVDNGKEVTQFILTLQYTRPDTLLLHRVPLALSASAPVAETGGKP